MADLSYTVDVNTTPAQRNLDALNQKINKVNDTFTSFKNAIIGFAVGGFVTQAFQMADAIQDISDSTNIATNVILGFNAAVMQSGGDAEKAQQGILKFVQSIGEAADGSLKTQSAFEDVGVSLKDLGSLSEQQLLAKTIAGLAKVEDAGKRSVIQMELFGKALRGVSAQGLATAFGPAVASSTEYAQSIKSAADAQQNFENVVKTLQLELLKALKPISDIAVSLLEAGSATKKFISAVMDIAVVVGTFFAITKAIKLVVMTFEALIAAPALLMRGWAALVRTFDAFMVQLRAMMKAGEVTSATMNGLQKRFHWLGVAISEIGKALGILSAGFVAFYKFVIPEGAQRKIEEYFGKLKELVSGAQPDQGRGNAQLHLEMYKQQQEELEKQANVQREIQDALAKRKKELSLVSEAFAKQTQDSIKQLDLEKQLVGKSEEYAEVIRAQEEIFKRSRDEINKLIIARDSLQGNEKKLAPLYDEQIAKIKEQAKVDAERIKVAIEGLQGVKLLEQDRLNNIERINLALQKQATYDESILNIRRQAQDALGKAEFEGAQMQRTPLEQKIEEIKRNAELAARDAGRAFAQQFEGMELTAQDAQRLADGLDLIAQKYKAIADEQLKNLEASRSFSVGWKNAFDEYMDNATNAARRAGEVFRSVTGNMESAIDKFVETGKFSFSDFARSVIQDLIKIELKAQATQLLKGLGGAGGIFSAIGSLLGFAEGGSPPVNKPSIVGEKGPELFVPKTAGTVIPNNMLGGGSQTVSNTYITNNISAIDAKSVAQLFAENRKTLLGTIQLAQKELPYANR